jgi:hypothetical protein
MVWRMPLPESVSRGAAAVRRRLGLRPSALPSATAAAPPPLDPLLVAGQLIREAREAEGIGLRQLAHQTRISTVVLEALERGWRDRLPEAAYLRTMLSLLERRLQLPAGSLDGALPPEQPLRAGTRSGARMVRFTPGSIDVFTTWQGTILYGAITLALIYGLNLQQRRLAARGLLTTLPIPPISRTDAEQAADAHAPLIAAHPEILPLRRAAQGQALGLLGRQRGDPSTALSVGVLRLALEKPTRVVVRPQGLKAIDLSEARGDLALSLRPPFAMTLSPPPRAGAVSWNGRDLSPAPSPESGGPDGSTTAEYRYPSTTGGAPATAPRP